ncbi:MAG: NUDIX pyrophosphatase [Anaerolineae bacterium]|nr:NUDIX pyrophosphatase [Anaerolineae bacterium]
MSRAPFNVAVYPYRAVGSGEFEYALLKRADAGFWQGVSGGGEGGETPLEAARRETLEETGIPSDSTFLQLDTVEPIPVIEFRASSLWGEDIYVIPQYWFGVLVTGRTLLLSREHSEYRWLRYEQARALLKYDGNKTALWELNQRLRGRGP